MGKEDITVNGKECTLFCANAPAALIVQPADLEEWVGLENEYRKAAELCGKDICLAALRINDWNNELSPWRAPAVFGNEGFGDGAETTLGFIEKELLQRLFEELGKELPVTIAGYSLAGLFSLWAASRSQVFSACAGVSPSVWFPGWREYMTENRFKCRSVYLSLGKKEERTRNRTMDSVGENIREMAGMLEKAGVTGILEWNDGDHFREPDLRTAKGIAWCVNRTLK